MRDFLIIIFSFFMLPCISFSLEMDPSNFPYKVEFTSWCSAPQKLKTGKYIKAASEFTDLDPRLLLVGMSSEGMSIKKEHSPSDEYYVKGNKFFAKDYEGKEWRVSNDEVIRLTNYGDSWVDDGNDTFGYEYPRLKEKGLIPSWFSSDQADNYYQYQDGEGPDFLFYDESVTNEPARRRFLRSDVYYRSGNRVPYSNRVGFQKPTKGDYGRTAYKTPQAMVYANAAMWKDSQIKLKELITDFRKRAEEMPLGPKRDKYLKQLDRIKSSDFSNYEKVFWSKVMFNGGQGTQAGAFEMFKYYLDKGYLLDNEYLEREPEKHYSKDMYKNAIYVTYSYKYAEEKGCPKDLPDASRERPSKPLKRSSDSSGIIQNNQQGNNQNR